MREEAQTITGRRREIVEVAGRLLDEEGPDGLTMRRLGERLGIQAPSIYKHFSDKEEIEHALISDAFEEMALRFQAVQDTQPGPRLRGLAAAYRDFARQRPHRYRLVTQRRLDRALIVPGVEDAAARPLLEALGGDAHLARATFAFVHGMAILELDHRFPPDADLDQAWERGLGALAEAAC